LILHSAAQLKGYKPNDSEVLQTAEMKVDETLNRLHQYLKEWMGSPQIIGPSFGHRKELEVHFCNYVYTPFYTL